MRGRVLLPCRVPQVVLTWKVTHQRWRHHGFGTRETRRSHCIDTHGRGRLDLFLLALAKTEQIELIRLVLPAGKEMPEHHVKGDITLLCLSGDIAFTTRGQPATLKAGEMLYVEGGAPHAVRALADSVALLTIVLRH